MQLSPSPTSSLAMKPTPTQGFLTLSRALADIWPSATSNVFNPCETPDEGSSVEGRLSSSPTPVACRHLESLPTQCASHCNHPACCQAERLSFGENFMSCDLNDLLERAEELIQEERAAQRENCIDRIRSICERLQWIVLRV